MGTDSQKIDILPYEPEMAEKLTRLYNAAIVDVPQCYPVGARQFAEALDTIEGVDAEIQHLQNHAVLVARENGNLVAFADMGIGCPLVPTREAQGVLRFFWYAPGHRTAGQHLLDAVLDYGREHGVTHIQAFPQEYRFPVYHLKAAYLSERMGHVEALLGMNGYRRIRGEVFLQWHDFNVQVSGTLIPEIKMVVEQVPGCGKLPGITVRALCNGQEMGVCKCVSCGEYGRAEAAQEWVFTKWLGVKQKMQGQGVGRRLLSRALDEASGVGYKHAAISTEWNNYRAFVFYSNFGYEVADWTYGLALDFPLTIW